MSPNNEALQFLPLYIMGMLKSSAFRSTNDVTADLRTYIWNRLGGMTVSQMVAYYYPRMMALHNIPDTCGVPDEQGHITLPDMLNLTRDSMTLDGVYLLEDGDTILLWIGKAVDVGFLQAVFGVLSLELLDTSVAERVVGTRSNHTSMKIANIIRQVRSERPVPFMR